MNEHRKNTPAGYAALTEKFRLEVIPNWHQSLIAETNTHQVNQYDGIIEEIYPNRYLPDDSIGGQLEFALKYDGTNLGILARIFDAVKPKDIEKYVLSKPKGKYARRIWFFYEMLTGTRLKIDDLKTGAYENVLESDEYYTLPKSQQIRRQRLNNNLLGDVRFCPMLRRTETLQNFESANLSAKCKKIITAYPPQLLKRAMSYLYTKETKSSFEIEHIKPNSNRTDRFIALLLSAEKEDFCTKEKLIELQNRVVDSRFQDTDYRDNQNYIGESISWQQEKIHYVPPRPEILSSLMEGLVDANKRMENSQINAVIQAACLSFGFVFVHPFEDGNGRIHRFLIHNILARRGFNPAGLIFPISASMLKDPAGYDAVLERFSRSIMQLVKYKIDKEGRLTIVNPKPDNIDYWYRYIDFTFQAETLFRFIERTIDFELKGELQFMVNYDQAKRSIQEIVDMPDKKIDLFIHACLQNDGHLSQRKRDNHFSTIKDEEILQMERVMQRSFFSHRND